MVSGFSISYSLICTGSVSLFDRPIIHSDRTVIDETKRFTLRNYSANTYFHKTKGTGSDARSYIERFEMPEQPDDNNIIMRSSDNSLYAEHYIDGAGDNKKRIVLRSDTTKSIAYVGELLYIGQFHSAYGFVHVINDNVDEAAYFVKSDFESVTEVFLPKIYIFSSYIDYGVILVYQKSTSQLGFVTAVNQSIVEVNRIYSINDYDIRFEDADGIKHQLITRGARGDHSLIIGSMHYSYTLTWDSDSEKFEIKDSYIASYPVEISGDLNDSNFDNGTIKNYIFSALSPYDLMIYDSLNVRKYHGILTRVNEYGTEGCEIVTTEDTTSDIKYFVL
jgi:hypothetical protein